MAWWKKVFVGGLIVISGSMLPVGVGASEGEVAQELMEGRVVEVVNAGKEEVMGQMVPFEELKVEITRGSLEGQVVLITHSGAFGGSAWVNFETYQVGDKLKIFRSVDALGEDQLVIEGRVKRDGLIALASLFVICVLVVGRVWGALSLVGMGISFGVIFKLVVPMIIGGANPVLAAVVGALLIIPSTFYISHGFNIKTHVGVVTTAVALVFTGMLAVAFVDLVHLTGYASEEAGFLQVERQGSVDIRGLLIAGIIIGTLGILDDVTVGQASVVSQIKAAKPTIGMLELFKQGMKVGQDHISSMVNTLVLVYAGSALPLILLFYDDRRSFGEILESELIAEEIVRMLVGSVGLVLVAPLATLLAAYWFSRKNIKK